ncbi:MAG: glycosyltransferase, partial [Gammaproteobacteria bacterium]|nr:glycosyltransferase [Gammaproteobacteria bacterium]
NHALADTLEPSVMGHQIGCSSLAWDVWRICEAVNDPLSWYPPAEQLEQLLSEHSETALISRWKSALAVIETIPSDQVLLSIAPTWRLRAGRFIGRGLRALRRRFAFR